MNIEKKLIKYNFSSRNGKKIEYIVIHDTNNKGKGADAEAHFRYFNGGNRNASAHYFVDDKKILQLIDDKYAAWHVGDGRGRFGITNQNSIGIEICVNADGDYNKALANAIELTRYLMKKYNIPLERVVRHYDASRKLCPASMSANNWAKWQWFKEQLEKKQTKKGQVLANVLNIRVGAGTQFKVVGQYKKGDIIEILEEKSDWYRTNKGWVCKDYVKIIN
ncbi:N-acetylmuramoyl-L-alanine amidase [Caloramator australicus]|uniref:N-acetylmuramoyl-L-alanine amidase n=1 Tax=Caloramator australicus RC3 TaxID=857293 RepID=I7KTH8_9CLOT|nr:N-acetylmuramoyl-L-alanine amidase [Caloramator australicus]CCJ33083.1 N-acetylmuramoyl-L-alanine amidase cwlL precursor (Cellwall hydrolase) (Autolysin) [Caloramator australicus RC3]